MYTPKDLERFDRSPMHPDSLAATSAATATILYIETGATYPVSGDALARGKAEWDR